MIYNLPVKHYGTKCKIKGQNSYVLYSSTVWEIKQLASLHFLCNF